MKTTEDTMREIKVENFRRWFVAGCAALAVIFSAAAAFSATITVSWDPNTETDMHRYRVYRATTSGGPYVMIGEVMHPTTTHVDNTLTVDDIYYYVVTALDFFSNESNYSEEVSQEINTVPPAPPVGITATVQTASLDWLRDPRLRRWAKNRDIEVLAVSHGTSTVVMKFPSKKVALKFRKILRLNGYNPEVKG